MRIIKSKNNEFTIYKNFVIDGGVEVLTIFVKHYLTKNQSKNRLLLFNSESATYKKEKQAQAW